jgi:dephospho-CoA kinase
LKNTYELIKAVKRSIERDKSSEEKVKQILKSQLSNKERLKKANVAFCSLWKREYTIKQVKKAWDLLLKRLQ